MKSTRRCLSHDKRIYLSRRGATQAVRNARKKHGKHLRVYRADCGAWHLTSQRNKEE